MNEFNVLDRAKLDSAMCWIIGRLEIKLDEAKKKFPDREFKEQEAIISWLREYERETLKSWAELRAIDRLYREQVKQNEFLKEEVKRLSVELAVYKEGI